MKIRPIIFGLLGLIGGIPQAHAIPTSLALGADTSASDSGRSGYPQQFATPFVNLVCAIKSASQQQASDGSTGAWLDRYSGS